MPRNRASYLKRERENAKKLQRQEKLQRKQDRETAAEQELAPVETEGDETQPSPADSEASTPPQSADSKPD